MYDLCTDLLVSSLVNFEDIGQNKNKNYLLMHL